MKSVRPRRFVRGRNNGIGALMIAFLQGELVSKNLNEAVLNVGGVGYEVSVPLSTFDQLPPEGAQVKLLIHDYIREDAHLLFGFISDSERQLFRLLQSVSGIGPKTALGALSGLSPRALRLAITSRDSKTLSKIPGIGKKTAERIVVELVDKINPLDALASDPGAPDSGESEITASMRDAVLALCALGQQQETALKLVRRAADEAGETLDTEQLIRRALSSH